MNPATKIQPTTAAEISADWIELRRMLIAHEGCLVRAGVGHTIEVQLTGGDSCRFLPLTLPNGGTRFVTAEERNEVLRRLEEKPTPSGQPSAVSSAPPQSS